MVIKEKHLSTLNRIGEVDGLRGLAILMVIAFHYINNQLVLSGNPIGRFLCKITSFGWVGVDLFFVLSGFLIGSILLRTRNNKQYFRIFFLRRIFRIAPNYYLFLLVYSALISISFFQDNYMLNGNNSIPVWSYFTLLHNFYMARLENMGNGALSITWSIAVEEQFYVVFPLIVYFFKVKLLPYFLIAVIAIAVYVRGKYEHWIPAYVLLISRMDVLALGVLVAYANENLLLSNFNFYKRSLVMVLMTLDILFCAITYYKLGDLGSIKHTLFGVFFSGCLILAIVKAPGSSFLTNKVLMWIGKISYSLYLFHYLLLILCHQFIGNKMGVVITDFKDVLASVVALLISFILAWLVFEKVEAPFVRWGKEIYQY